jgi:hypothetical protein
VEAHAARAAENPWVERLARFGLVAQGVSFALIAALAIVAERKLPLSPIPSQWPPYG